MAETETKKKLFIRIVNTDIPGHYPLKRALRKVKGIGHNLSHAICVRMGLPAGKQLHDFNADEVKGLSEKLKAMQGMTPWMLNRRKDYDSGDDQHLLTTDIQFRKRFDIKRLQKIKSNRGLRHAAGLPVRGQRTKAHFRKGKALGVRKKKK